MLRYDFFKAAALIALSLSVPATATDPGSDGVILIYRGKTAVGLASACPVRYEGREIAELGRGKFVKWPVAPGRYVLTNKTSSVEVNVAAGETRYVRCNMKMGVLTYRADLQISDRTSFNDLGDMEEKTITLP